jgi:hypothetical protein
VRKNYGFLYFNVVGDVFHCKNLPSQKVTFLKIFIHTNFLDSSLSDNTITSSTEIHSVSMLELLVIGNEEGHK